MQGMYICPKICKWKRWENWSHRRYWTNFSPSYFIEKPNFKLEGIEVRLNEIKLERLQKKGEKLSSREHDKDRTIQQNKRWKLPKFACPANKNTSDAEFSDDTSPIGDGKGVNDRKMARIKK